MRGGKASGSAGPALCKASCVAAAVAGKELVEVVGGGSGELPLALINGESVEGLAVRLRGSTTYLTENGWWSSENGGPTHVSSVSEVSEVSSVCVDWPDCFDEKDVLQRAHLLLGLNEVILGRLKEKKYLSSEYADVSANVTALTLGEPDVQWCINEYSKGPNGVDPEVVAGVAEENSYFIQVQLKAINELKDDWLKERLCAILNKALYLDLKELKLDWSEEFSSFGIDSYHDSFDYHFKVHKADESIAKNKTPQEALLLVLAFLKTQLTQIKHQTTSNTKGNTKGNSTATIDTNSIATIDTNSIATIDTNSMDTVDTNSTATNSMDTVDIDLLDDVDLLEICPLQNSFATHVEKLQRYERAMKQIVTNEQYGKPSVSEGVLNLLESLIRYYEFLEKSFEKEELETELIDEDERWAEIFKKWSVQFRGFQLKDSHVHSEVIRGVFLDSNHSTNYHTSIDRDVNRDGDGDGDVNQEGDRHTLTDQSREKRLEEGGHELLELRTRSLNDFYDAGRLNIKSTDKFGTELDQLKMLNILFQAICRFLAFLSSNAKTAENRTMLSMMGSNLIDILEPTFNTLLAQRQSSCAHIGRPMISDSKISDPMISDSKISDSNIRDCAVESSDTNEAFKHTTILIPRETIYEILDSFNLNLRHGLKLARNYLHKSLPRIREDERLHTLLSLLPPLPLLNKWAVLVLPSCAASSSDSVWRGKFVVPKSEKELQQEQHEYTEKVEGLYMPIRISQRATEDIEISVENLGQFYSSFEMGVDPRFGSELTQLKKLNLLLRIFQTHFRHFLQLDTDDQFQKLLEKLELRKRLPHKDAPFDFQLELEIERLLYLHSGTIHEKQGLILKDRIFNSLNNISALVLSALNEYRANKKAANQPLLKEQNHCLNILTKICSLTTPLSDKEIKTPLPENENKNELKTPLPPHVLPTFVKVLLIASVAAIALKARTHLQPTPTTQPSS